MLSLSQRWNLSGLRSDKNDLHNPIHLFMCLAHHEHRKHLQRIASGISKLAKTNDKSFRGGHLNPLDPIQLGLCADHHHRRPPYAHCLFIWVHQIQMFIAVICADTRISWIKGRDELENYQRGFEGAGYLWDVS